MVLSLSHNILWIHNGTNLCQAVYALFVQARLTAGKNVLV